MKSMQSLQEIMNLYNCLLIFCCIWLLSYSYIIFLTCYSYTPTNELFVEKFKVEWFLCADWKFLALILGINSDKNQCYYS